MSSFFSYAADGNQLNVASIISFGELSINSSSYIARMFKPMLRRAPASNPVNVRDAFKAGVIQEGLESDCHWPPNPACLSTSSSIAAELSITTSQEAHRRQAGLPAIVTFPSK
ncbi:hypothetical protein Cob_v011391 [Colletotrichum orbiculare MAFF 240422]|uniref:Uncharacterized protein n=1 Tax=Colletotrichum orbiculare (strain 104-T / ATCC 96160 / CBS 514.97 / LARS 414 / MAFF 240422) TaxID=1213857 RepID=A0A484FB55_COLOR|nr:hypothetical protein Cob_v011391 [Colletotrichum orbiculare MAFF 240422]